MKQNERQNTIQNITSNNFIIYLLVQQGILIALSGWHFDWLTNSCACPAYHDPISARRGRPCSDDSFTMFRQILFLYLWWRRLTTNNLTNATQLQTLQIDMPNILENLVSCTCLTCPDFKLVCSLVKRPTRQSHGKHVNKMCWFLRGQKISYQLMHTHKRNFVTQSTGFQSFLLK